ncbi:MAG: EAL domain-containing protein [Marinobacter sp.]|uniref:bifunctional diguanylate cyclase/phosphodiesterase n=1 Tax=Marinobacter sp. TaxID=50741 RepID=UPI00299E0F16|nr:EAL domain-containing protein [Marinobacter sp.]MDX1635945.1 EAL domain-containing protein [Marinobacter sp.]
MASIIWLLGLLILLFSGGMLLLSQLNLNYSQQALSDLRRQQIEDVVQTGLARIHARQQALAQHTTALARLGESLYRMAPETEPANALTMLDSALRAHLQDFDGAFGAGLWFEPGYLTPAGEHYAAYFIKPDPQQPLQRVKGANNDDFRTTAWFDRTLGPDWTLADQAPGQVYWSPVYFDFNSNRALLTLAAAMVDDQGELIGMATTDWTSDQVIELVSRVEVTANSFAFLNDRNNRNLSSLARGNDTLLEQKLIDAILAENLSASTDSAGDSDEALQTRALRVNGRVYELFYAATAAGTVYGAGVPRDEIDQVLAPMRRANFQILAVTGSVLLLLSVFLAYRIIQLMRELRASYTDSLTGLPNRARLLRDLARTPSATLVLINLDRFQEINSLFGNRCGDQVLITLASRIKRFSRSHGESLRGRLYRLAADEFALLGQAAPKPELAAFADRLNGFIRTQEVHWQQQVLTVDASIGIACRDQQESEASDQLLSQATIALGQAREQHRHFQIYRPEQAVEKAFEHNLHWARRLKDALANDRVVPYFQPIHDNQLGRVTKYECLVRLSDPELGVVSPGQFLGIARRLRLDRQLTRLMVQKSFTRFRHSPYQFSINLSYNDLMEPEVLTAILDAMKDSRIGERVIFEILESDGIENYNEVMAFIEKVKPYGCQIAIDDFGTGYSNFEQLLRLNVDIIKIDGSLIRNLDQDVTALRVTRGIVQFARNLGIETVAEFVHNQAVQDKVVSLGINYSQGAWLAMPAPDLQPGTADIVSH